MGISTAYIHGKGTQKWLALRSAFGIIPDSMLSVKHHQLRYSSHCTHSLIHSLHFLCHLASGFASLWGRDPDFILLRILWRQLGCFFVGQCRTELVFCFCFDRTTRFPSDSQAPASLLRFSHPTLFGRYIFTLGGWGFFT